MKCVAQILVGIVALCIFGVVQDWYCLIGSLVILHSHVTVALIANASYVEFVYTYVSLACSYMVFIYLYISHTCSCIAHVLCPLSMTPSHMRDISMCGLLLQQQLYMCSYRRSKHGKTTMGLVEASYLGMLVVLALMHHMIFSLLW